MFDVGAALFEKTGAILEYTLLAKTLNELFIEGLGSAKSPMVEKRGPVDGVTSGLGEAFGDGAGSMPDLETKVEEGIQDVFYQLLEAVAQLVGRLGEEKEKVDVRSGIQEASAIPAVGYEGKGAGGPSP